MEAEKAADSSPRGESGIPKPRYHGIFVGAFVGGMGAALASSCACAGGLRLLALYLPLDDYFLVPIYLATPCFVGGAVSGMILQFDLENRVYRLLFLAAASPALPIWIFTVIFVVAGMKIETKAFAVVTGLCLVSILGSVVGYQAGQRFRRWRRDYRPRNSPYPWWREDEEGSKQIAEGKCTNDQRDH